MEKGSSDLDADKLGDVEKKDYNSVGEKIATGAPIMELYSRATLILSQISMIF